MTSTARVFMLSLSFAVAIAACDDKHAAPTPDKPPKAQPSQKATTASAKPDASGEQAKAEPSASAKAEGSAVASAASASASATKDAGKAPKSAGSAKAAASGDKNGGEAPKVTGDKKTESSYAAWLQAAGKYSVGKAGSVQAVLVAKGEFKCNENYPYKFKLGAPPSGVSYPSPIARNISKGKKRSTLTIPFTASEAGKKTISGKFYFSVCDAQSCVIKKQPMSVTVTVE